MSDEPPHPGDALIATCMLLGVEFKGDETHGFQFSHAGASARLPWSQPFYSKRMCAAKALAHMGYKISVDGDVTK